MLFASSGNLVIGDPRGGLEEGHGQGLQDGGLQHLSAYCSGTFHSERPEIPDLRFRLKMKFRTSFYQRSEFPEVSFSLILCWETHQGVIARGVLGKHKNISYL